LLLIDRQHIASLGFRGIHISLLLLMELLLLELQDVVVLLRLLVITADLDGVTVGKVGQHADSHAAILGRLRMIVPLVCGRSDVISSIASAELDIRIIS